MIDFFFFGMPIKTLGSLGKIRVGRVTGNTHIFFFGLRTCFLVMLFFHIRLLDKLHNQMIIEFLSVVLRALTNLPYVFLKTNTIQKL